MMNSFQNSTVVIEKTAPVYPPPDAAPFHPSQRWPEYGRETAPCANKAYEAVRNTLRHLGLDAANFGTPAWNPIGALVKPGARIVLKPNWVMDHNYYEPGGWECLVTHPAVIRAVLDFVALARPSEVIVGDAPVQGCDFEKLLALGFRRVVDHVAGCGVPVRIVDFRRTIICGNRGPLDVQQDQRPLENYRLVDIGGRSMLEPISSDARRFRVTIYDPRKMRENHAPGRHRYLISREILDADLVINMPKLKTHKKSGITGALKNLVGINGNKEFLPHHRKGWPGVGGDNYEQFTFLRAMSEEILDFANVRLHRRTIARWCYRIVNLMQRFEEKLGRYSQLEGSWHGNDTIWRTSLDLNRVFTFADKDGIIQKTPQRSQLILMDGIVGGQGDGPLCPEPAPLGVLIGAWNPAAADWVGALALGLDPRKMAITRCAFDVMDLPVASFQADAIRVVIDGEERTMGDFAKSCSFRARAPSGWRGHIELGAQPCDGLAGLAQSRPEIAAPEA